MKTTKRVLSVLLSIALLTSCLSVFANASGVFKKDDLTLGRFQKTNFFKDAIRDYGAPLHFTSSFGILAVADDGTVTYPGDRTQIEEMEADGWDGFYPLPTYWSTAVVSAYNEDNVFVGRVTVKVQQRWWAWILAIALVPVVAPIAVIVFNVVGWIQGTFF